MARVSPHPAIDGFYGGSRAFQRLEEVVAMAQRHAAHRHGRVVSDRDVQSRACAHGRQDLNPMIGLYGDQAGRQVGVSPAAAAMASRPSFSSSGVMVERWS